MRKQIARSIGDKKPLDGAAGGGLWGFYGDSRPNVPYGARDHRAAEDRRRTKLPQFNFRRAARLRPIPSSGRPPARRHVFDGRHRLAEGLRLACCESRIAEITPRGGVIS